jgi:molybdopterin converting factor small subunit
MQITVRLFATFRDGRDKVINMEHEVGATVQDIVDKLAIKRSEVAILLINGRDGKIDSSLNDGDIVSLFPPVGGG